MDLLRINIETHYLRVGYVMVTNKYHNEDILLDMHCFLFVSFLLLSNLLKVNRFIELLKPKRIHVVFGTEKRRRPQRKPNIHILMNLSLKKSKFPPFPVGCF